WRLGEENQARETEGWVHSLRASGGREVAAERGIRQVAHAPQYPKEDGNSVVAPHHQIEAPGQLGELRQGLPTGAGVETMEARELGDLALDRPVGVVGWA